MPSPESFEPGPLDTPNMGVPSYTEDIDSIRYGGDQQARLVREDSGLLSRTAIEGVLQDTSNEVIVLIGGCSDPIDEEPQEPGLSPFERAVHDSLTQNALGTERRGAGEGEEPYPRYYQIGPDGSLYPTSIAADELGHQPGIWLGGSEGKDEAQSPHDSPSIKPDHQNSSPDRPRLIDHHLEYGARKPTENMLSTDDDPGQEPVPHIVFDHEGRATSIVDAEGTIWRLPKPELINDSSLMGERTGRDAGVDAGTVWGFPMIARNISDKWQGHRPPFAHDHEGGAVDQLPLYGGGLDGLGRGEDKPPLREIATEELEIRHITPIDPTKIIPLHNRKPTDELYIQEIPPFEDKPQN